jgi:uncharacterized protein YdhG (YjbR/CyaY superfamily)
MMSSEIDSYLAQVTGPQRSALESLRETIRSIVPEAQECISYKIPAFRVDGHVVAGFAAYKNHMSYFPFSGSILSTLDSSLEGRARTKSALHFSEESPLSTELVTLLIQTRMAEIGDRGH